MVWANGRRPLVVGHRGGRGDGWPPENSLAAFARAASEGADAIELDVRASRDGAIVVLHDPDLTRMTDGADVRPAATLSSHELSLVRLHGGKERPPLLPEVLDWVESAGIGVNVEIKHDVPDRLSVVRGVADAIEHSSADVVVSSFDPLSLTLLAARAPRVRRSLLTHTEQGLYADVMRELAPRGTLFGMHLERTQAWSLRVEAYLRRGLFVGVWTVNDPQEALRLARSGVHALITDQPGILRQALESYRPHPK